MPNPMKRHAMYIGPVVTAAVFAILAGVRMLLASSSPDEAGKTLSFASFYGSFGLLFAVSALAGLAASHLYFRKANSLRRRSPRSDEGRSNSRPR